jgi:hypothetical protein
MLNSRRVPSVRNHLLLASLCVVAFAGAGTRSKAAAADAGALQLAAASSQDTPTFHGDAARTGWNSHETRLTPANVSGGLFGPQWNSPQFDSVTIGTNTYEPHMYASPLYVDSVPITAGTYAGSTFGVVFAATSTGYVYAVKAFDAGAATGVPAGTILWRTRLGQPSSTLDGGVTVGVLSTPVIDQSVSPPRLYVTSDVTGGDGRNWKVFALNLGSGGVLSGWPLTINDSTLAPINGNGPTTFEPAGAMSQRGALNLSPDGRYLYVPFGAYGDGGAGWMVSVDTRAPALASAFAGAPTTVAFANGGMWGSGGAAVDGAGDVLDTTGNSPEDSGDDPNVWGNSLLRWGSGSPLRLTGTYSPWNHCQMDRYDTDLGGGSPVVFDLDPATTSTPHLVAFGGKQGNAYLVDRAHLPGRLDQRPPCGTDASADASLLPPANQPQFGTRGPLNIFAPYSEDANNTNFAKSRTTPAYFRNAAGTSYLVIAGSTKLAVGDINPIPPSVIRLKVVTAAGQPAYLAVDGKDTTLSFKLAGTPIVTSNGTANPIIWVTDANVYRTDSLRGSAVPHPVLYALDALTMRVLWHSTPDQLQVGGKYNQPTVARGTVFVGTDRIQAFGSQGTSVTTVDDAVRGTGRNQFSYTGAGGWFHCSTACIAGSYNGTVSGTDAAGDAATIAFTGTRIRLYTAVRDNRGFAAVSVDGRPETMVDMYAPADAGNVLVYTSPALTAGAHTLKVRDTGVRDPAGTGTRIAIDRVEIIS